MPPFRQQWWLLTRTIHRACNVGKYENVPDWIWTLSRPNVLPLSRCATPLVEVTCLLMFYSEHNATVWVVWPSCLFKYQWLYQCLTAHQHKKGHTVPKQVSQQEKNVFFFLALQSENCTKNCNVWEHSLSGQVWTKCPKRPDTQSAPRGSCSHAPLSNIKCDASANYVTAAITTLDRWQTCFWSNFKIGHTIVQVQGKVQDISSKDLKPKRTKKRRIRQKET